MIQPMKLQEWERDVRNRQRNIVFPDTVLNEGRLFRTVISTSNQTPVQRFGVVLLAGSFFFGGAVTLALSIGELLAAKTAADRMLSGIAILPALGMTVFGIVLCVKSFFPQQKTRKIRGGYRNSHRV